MGREANGNYLIFTFIYRKRIALSLCGGLENGGPSDLEFDEHLVQYSEVRK